MKKVFYLFSAVLLSIIFISCNKDNKEEIDNSTLPGDYVAETLVLTVNNKYVETSNEVSIYGDMNKARMVLPDGVLTGEDGLVFDPLVVTPLSSSGGFALSAEKQSGTRTITMAGYIKWNRLHLNLTIKETSPILGRWKLETMFFDFENGTGLETVTVDGRDVPNAEFVDMMLGLEPKLTGIIGMLRFLETGNLRLLYFADGLGGDGDSEETSAQFMYYYIWDNVAYICPNMDAIEAENSEDSKALEPSLPSFDPKIAMKFAISGNTMKMNLTRDSFLPYVSRLQAVLQLVPDGELQLEGGSTVTYKNFVSSIFTIAQNSQQFDLGINLTKY